MFSFFLQALLDQHQEHKKKLGGMGDDPLEAARAASRNAKGGRFQYDTDDKGRQVAFSDDHDDGDDDDDEGNTAGKLHLNPVDVSFKPRRDILADATCVCFLPLRPLLSPFTTPPRKPSLRVSAHAILCSSRLHVCAVCVCLLRVIGIHTRITLGFCSIFQRWWACAWCRCCQ